MLESLEFNGIPPTLVGLRCGALLVQQYLYRGEMAERANVVYLQVGEQWHRLYFDCGIIFWRLSESPPQNSPGDGEFAYPLIDLGDQLRIKGELLDHLEHSPIDGGSQVQFVFRNGAQLMVRNVMDDTIFHIEQGKGATGSRG